MKGAGEIVVQSTDQQRLYQELGEIAQGLMPKYGRYWYRHSVATMGVATLNRILHYHELYKKILDVPGVICEFGVQWGATMSQLVALRTLYEPFNRSREIFGFDTFEGFPSVDGKDGAALAVGDYSSAENYQASLEKILTIHESLAPLPQIKKFGLIKGDASETIGPWLESHKYAIISMAIFDMDLYKPTKDVLEQILPRLTKGSLLVFDELNCPQFPGETLALDEVLGLNRLTLKRSIYEPYCSWAVFEG